MRYYKNIFNLLSADFLKPAANEERLRTPVDIRPDVGPHIRAEQMGYSVNMNKI